MSEEEGSNADAVVAKDRDFVQDNRNTQPTHPVEVEKPQPPKPVVVSNKQVAVSDVSSEEQTDPVIPKPISKALQQELQTVLQEPLNKNLMAVVQAFPEARVRDALEALKEAMLSQGIRNPTGWLISAIRGGYKPNAARRSSQGAKRPKARKRGVPDGFNEWFELARKTGVVIASEYSDEGELMIYGPESKEPYEQVRQAWPLEKLRERLENPPVPTPMQAEQLGSPGNAGLPPGHVLLAVEETDPKQQKQNALARLRAKINLPALRESAIAEAERWGFVIRGSEIFEAGC